MTPAAPGRSAATRARDPDGPEVDSTQIVAAGRYVALLCELRRSGKASIVLSADRGRTFSRLHPPVANGNQIALDAEGDLAIANAVIGGDGPWTYRLAVSTDRGTTWRVALTHTTVVSRDTPPSSIAIFGRSLRWVLGDHTLWTSDDAGTTWRATRTGRVRMDRTVHGTSGSVTSPAWLPMSCASFQPDRCP